MLKDGPWDTKIRIEEIDRHKKKDNGRELIDV